MGTIFSANDIRGRIGESLTTEYVWNVGKALAEVLSENGDIVVVKNSTNDQSITHALIEGLLLQGRSVVDGGEGNQQVIIAAIRESSAAGGALIAHDAVQNLVIITLFDSQGVVLTAETGLATINELAESGNFVPAAEKGQLKA